MRKALNSNMIILLISNEETKDIMKIVKAFEESGYLIEVVSKTIENGKGGFLRMLLGTLVASLLENRKYFSRKAVVRTS